MMVWTEIRSHFTEAFYPRLSEWFCAGMIMALLFGSAPAAFGHARNAACIAVVGEG